MNTLFGVISAIAGLGAWITHVVYCLTNALWVALLAGAICFPVGIIHGIMIWFGAGL